MLAHASLAYKIATLITGLVINHLGTNEFLDEQLARARLNEIIETDNTDESDDEDSPPRYELPVVPEGYVMDEETVETS